MRLSSILAGIAGAALIAAPVAAANPAAPLSVSSSVRASAPAGDSKLHAPGAVIGIALFAAIVIAGIVIKVSDDNDSDSP